MTIILATCQMPFARQIAGKVVVLDQGEDLS